MSQATAFYIFREDSVTPLGPSLGGHYCGPTRSGQYKMHAAWIDVDNRVWPETGHLYTDLCAGLAH